MKKKNLPQPHDSLFRITMSDLEKVKYFLRGTLPEKILQKLKLSTLRRDETSYVNKKLKKYFADVVYDCEFDSEVNFKISLLFEHRSTVPRFLFIQLLRYMLQIWEHQIEQNQPLQLVIPIVIYHGQQRWNARSFESYFSKNGLPEPLKAFVPRFDYWLEDLQKEAPASIRNRFAQAMLRMTLLLFKYIGSPNIISYLPVIFKDLRSIELSEKGIAEFETLLLYLFEEAKAPENEIMEVMETVTPKKYKKGTVAWQLEQKGIKKGIEQGIQKGIQRGIEKGIEQGEQAQKMEVARRMLKEEMDLDLIIKISGLSAQSIQDLKAEMK